MNRDGIRSMCCFLLLVSSVTSLSGCVGSNVATSKVMQFNLEVVDNKYARGGVNILLAPVYALTVAVDLVVFNTIEFWSGESPLNGEQHIFNSPNPTYQVNQRQIVISPEVKTKIPDSISNMAKQIYSVKTRLVNSNTIDYDIVYSNGEMATLRSDKSGNIITFYLDGKLITQTSLDALQAYQPVNH